MITFITILGIFAILYYICALIINKTQKEKALPNSLLILIAGLVVTIGLGFVAVIPAQECG